MLKKLAVLGIGVGLSLTEYAGAQEHNLPLLNSVGRYFGVGWSRGYQAGCYDGRFQAVKQGHPASMYASNSLLYPYFPGYQPHPGYDTQTGNMPLNADFAQPVYSDASNALPVGAAMQNGLQTTPTPAPVIPPKPVMPPPTWLRPFLKDEARSGTDRAAAESGTVETREEVQADEVSPSDQFKPKTELTEPQKEDMPNASDDDDLLTLTPPQNPMQRFNEARRRQGSNR